MKWLFWLLPPVFLLHDLEEIVKLAPWLTRHRSQLAELAAKNRLARRLVASINQNQSDHLANHCLDNPGWRVDLVTGHPDRSRL